jgi:hypothetical protein
MHMHIHCLVGRSKKNFSNSWWVRLTYVDMYARGLMHMGRERIGGLRISNPGWDFLISNVLCTIDLCSENRLSMLIVSLRIFNPGWDFLISHVLLDIGIQYRYACACSKIIWVSVK